MSAANKHTFSIASKINPATEKPFGDTYSGNFTVRRPTIGDNGNIALAYAAITSAQGIELNPLTLSPDAVNMLYVFSVMKIIGEVIPEWFDKDTLYAGDDELAVIEVYTEVERWLETFRRKQGAINSGEGIQDATLLVQAEV